MEKVIASNLSLLIQTETNNTIAYHIVDSLEIGSALDGFHQWSDGKNHLGSYLIENQDGDQYWLQFVTWHDDDNWYLVIFPKNKSKPLMEIHKTTGDQKNLIWTYSPVKQDGKNEERKKLFSEQTGNETIEILIPNDPESLGSFITNIFLVLKVRQEAENMGNPQTVKFMFDLVEQIKEVIKVNYPNLDQHVWNRTKDSFAWISIEKNKNAIELAHYEINKRYNKINFEIHFEKGKEHADYFKAAINTLPEDFEWFSWIKGESIRYKSFYSINEPGLAEKLAERFQLADLKLGDTLRNALSNFATTDENEARFIFAIQNMNVDALRKYFQVLEKLISNLNVKRKDPRVVFSCPKGESHLALTINQRYCIQISSRNTANQFGFISYDAIEGLVKSDEPFKGNMPADYYRTNALFDLDKYYDKILDSSSKELARGETSSHQISSNLYFEKAVFDEDYRESILFKLFGKMSSKNHLNLILYGPPGTGKTYHTVNRAVSIIDNIPEDELINRFPSRKDLKKRFNELLIKEWDNPKGQIGFITFHQSMSYEDFIEGIKPQEPTVKGGPVNYKVEPGIFLRMCLLADQKESHTVLIENNRIDFTPEMFTDFYYSFSNELPDQDVTDPSPYTLKTPEGYDFYLYKNSASSIVVKARSMKTSMSVSCNELTRVLFEGKTPTYKSYELPIVLKLLDGKGHIKSDITNADKPFVLIIDEINRGNISQIFGELITLIEEDKRLGNDEVLEVTLPYSKKKFGVPKNLFIIGTMNTADRSVEALDTALRRRFNFIEMLPDYGVIEKDGKLKETGGKLGDIDLKELLKTLNKRIEKLLDKDHQIGHSYFLSVDSISKLKSVFYNKIIPLLQEYFYGDYGKIGLVIGEGFFEQRSKGMRENKNFFASFPDYPPEELLERQVFRLKNTLEMENDLFKTAIKNLMNQTIEDQA